jgi:hypothetical protein
MPRRQPVAPGSPPGRYSGRRLAVRARGPPVDTCICREWARPRYAQINSPANGCPPDPMDPGADVVARSGGAYLTSSVPFISVWTSHRKPYVPGASAGTLYVTSFGPPNGSSPKTLEENELS